jgi:hypothetical protein
MNYPEGSTVARVLLWLVLAKIRMAVITIVDNLIVKVTAIYEFAP